MEKNDFVKIDYIGRIKGTDEIFDLTKEDIAKEKGVFKEGQKYGPVTVVIGAGHLVKGLDDKMAGLLVGEKKKIDISAESGFGDRKGELIKVFSAGQFKNSKVPMVPGVTVNLGDMIGKIQSVSGGRVRIDFNHPLAGKDLEYEVEVLEKIDEPEEKAKALIELYGIKTEKVKLEEDTLEIEGPEMEKNKKRLTEEILKYIKEITKVKITDIYEKKEK